MGSVGAGIGAAKSGIFTGFGKGAGKTVAKEVAQQTTSSMPPPYFFKLAEKIRKMGDDVTAKSATKDREVVTKFKDYQMTEDVSTGNIEILKQERGGFREDVFMKFEPGVADESTKIKPKDQYEEFTARPDQDGKMRDIEQGVPDNILEEAGEAKSIKYARGGRAGYQTGGDVSYDATDPIYGSSAATFTPNTVMDQFGNQVQAEMGNNFNKPLIPQVTNQAANKEGIMNSSPVVSQAGGTGEIDMPIAGGINNEMGILPVEPQLPGFKNDTNSKEDNSFITQPGFPDSDGDGIDDRLSDEEKERRLNPIGGGKLEQAPQYYTGKDYGPGKNMAYSAVAPQRGMRFVYDQNGGRHSIPIEGYEGPIDNPIKRLAQGTITKFASGGLAYMLGE